MLYLASQSPRRQALLQQIHVAYQPLVVAVDETPHPQETPTAYVQRLALAKAKAGQAQLTSDALVLGADTTVVLAGQILGKPNSPAQAQQMLQQLSGATHEVLTAVALIATDYEKVLLSHSQVTFKVLTPIEIAAYVNTGEPLDKAGSYAIQGQAAVFVQHLSGSYSGVMGLPLFETSCLLGEVGMTMLNAE